jgi:hypothetical protein
MDPYSPGVVGARGLHAVPTRAIAAKGSRKVAGKEYRFFYNPMWSFFGDRSAGPAGTHFYSGKHVSSYWHIYDQVLLRPSVVPKLHEVRILDGDGETSFVTETGRPRKSGSDHLPILVKLQVDPLAT